MHTSCMGAGKISKSFFLPYKKRSTRKEICWNLKNNCNKNCSYKCSEYICTHYNSRLTLWIVTYNIVPGRLLVPGTGTMYIVQQHALQEGGGEAQPDRQCCCMPSTAPSPSHHSAAHHPVWFHGCMLQCSIGLLCDNLGFARGHQEPER